MQVLESFGHGEIWTMVKTYNVAIFLINRQIYPRNLSRQEDACCYARNTGPDHSNLDGPMSTFIPFEDEGGPHP